VAWVRSEFPNFRSIRTRTGVFLILGRRGGGVFGNMEGIGGVFVAQPGSEFRGICRGMAVVCDGGRIGDRNGMGMPCRALGALIQQAGKPADRAGWKARVPAPAARWAFRQAGAWAARGCAANTEIGQTSAASFPVCARAGCSHFPRPTDHEADAIMTRTLSQSRSRTFCKIFLVVATPLLREETGKR